MLSYRLGNLVYNWLKNLTSKNKKQESVSNTYTPPTPVDPYTAAKYKQEYYKTPQANTKSDVNTSKVPNLKDLNIKVIIGGVAHKIYSSVTGGKTNYYYADGKDLKTVTNNSTIKSIKQKTTGGGGSTVTPTSSAKKTTTSSTTSKTTTSNSKGTTAPAASTPASRASTSAQAAPKVEDVKPEKIWTADELAKYFGIDYNEANMLARLNLSTEDYYNLLMARHSDNRDRLSLENAGVINELLRDQVGSYANVAPTAAGQASLAANALRAMLKSDALNAYNETSMLDTHNILREMKAAELAGNTAVARDQYNATGTFLAQAATDKDKADAVKYKAEVEALGDRYAAERSRAKLEAEGAADKYSGLVRARTYNAQAAANNFNKVNERDYLYNYYMNMYGGDTKAADTAVANLITSRAIKGGGN